MLDNLAEAVFEEALGFMVILLCGVELCASPNVFCNFALLFAVRVIRDAPKGTACALKNPALSASVHGFDPFALYKWVSAAIPGAPNSSIRSISSCQDLPCESP